MGIKQTKNLPSGYSAQYARIVSLDCVGVDNKRADIVLFWYKDKSARDAGAQPAESERHIVMLTPDEVDAILAVVYKSEGFRALHPDAVDVIEEEAVENEQGPEAVEEDEAPEGENIKTKGEK